MLVEVAGRNGSLDSGHVQARLEAIAGVAHVLCKEPKDDRLIFEVQSQKGQLVRGDLARAIVDAGWDLNELRAAGMSLEEIFLELTGGQTQTQTRESEEELRA